MLLAVYGTLRRGAINHHELNGASFMGEAFIGGGVADNRLYLDDISEHAVELYEVPDFTELDAFEAPDYVRTRVTLLDGRRVWAYL
jgi:gamma-glutamylcyclotransferase (GGCT)/AIG2-like uncharacterized protein YtfP